MIDVRETAIPPGGGLSARRPVCAALMLITVGWATLAGCDDTGDVELANGTLGGQVIATRPIVGATVRVTHVMQDGRERGDVIAETTTDEDGRFIVETGVKYGEFLVEAFGGSTSELVSGQPVALDRSVRLSAAIVDFLADEQQTALVVSPVTTLAEALGTARLARGDKERSWPEAQFMAALLIGEHFGDVDPLHAQPLDPTASFSGTLTESARYGLVLAALSQLATRIADESGVSASVVNSALLTQALAADLSSAEALFDGTGPGGPVRLGSCPVPDVCRDETCSTVCDIGPRTVREALANELEAFVASAANVTGLDASDIAELKANIAKNAEPEFGGKATTETDGPGLTLAKTGFFVDSDTGIWWTGNSGPTIQGSVELRTGDAVTIVVRVNDDVELPGQIVAGEASWFAELPEGAFRPSPQVNTLRVIARDAVGNLTEIEKDVRLDATAATVEFQTTVVIDESKDTIDFSTTPPTHTHGGPSVELPGTGCPKVYKHVTLMDGTENPLRFRFRVVDTGVGLDDASVQYRVRRKASSTWLVDWTTPANLTPITGGVEAQLTMRRADIAQLGTTAGDYEIVIRGADRLGQGRELTACWNHNPLAPPLSTSRVRNGLTTSEPSPIKDATLGERKLTNNNLAPLINGVSPSGGAGVMLFDVENAHDEPVYFEIGWIQPGASRLKTWVHSAVVQSVTTVNLDCNGNNFSNCDESWPYAATRTNVSKASVPNLIGGTRVWDVTNPNSPQAVSPCTGCGANRYLIDKRPNATNRRVYRVMLVATDLSALHPGATNTGGYQELALGNATVTGKSLGTFTRCTKIEAKLINGELSSTCTQRTTYRNYIALESAQIEVPQPLTGIVRTAVGTTAAPRELDSLVDKRPAVSAQFTWTTTEQLPPKPAGMQGAPVP